MRPEPNKKKINTVFLENSSRTDCPKMTCEKGDDQKDGKMDEIQKLDDITNNDNTTTIIDDESSSLDRVSDDDDEKNDTNKPSHSYISLIANAILASPEKRLVLSDIYSYVLGNYSYFRNKGAGWRNSIRHNLSLNECFLKANRSPNGKGHFWTINPANYDDFSKGDFRRRRAQRRARRFMGYASDVPEYNYAYWSSCHPYVPTQRVQLYPPYRMPSYYSSSSPPPPPMYRATTPCKSPSCCASISTKTEKNGHIRKSRKRGYDIESLLKDDDDMVEIVKRPSSTEVSPSSHQTSLAYRPTTHFVFPEKRSSSFSPTTLRDSRRYSDVGIPSPSFSPISSIDRYRSHYSGLTPKSRHFNDFSRISLVQ